VRLTPPLAPVTQDHLNTLLEDMEGLNGQCGGLSGLIFNSEWGRSRGGRERHSPGAAMYHICRAEGRTVWGRKQGQTGGVGSQ
jgi:hypothetical protein